jgi:hypothetical protein
MVILLFVFVLGLTICIIHSETYPLGSDTYFHLKLADLYVKGNFTGAINTMFTVIKYPYPPFFQAIVLGPIALSPNPYLGLRILEASLLPLTFLATMYLVWKHSSAKAAFFTGVALLASWSFIDGTLQARPESLDLLLLPIIVLAVLETRKKTAGIISSIMIWSHGLASISSLFGIFLLKLKDRTWHKTFLYIILAIIPVIILSLYFFDGAIKTWIVGQTQTSNPQEYIFWHNPFPWILTYCGLSLLGIPFLLRRNKTKLETLLTFAFIGNTAMLIFWADRWLQYNAIPWAALFGIGISRWHGWKLYIAIGILTVVLAIYVSTFILYSINHLWWQPGD